MDIKIPETMHSPGAIILEMVGFEMVYQGQVHDVYALEDNDEFLLLCFSDRMVVCNFLLPCTMPGRARYLVALTNFWVKYVFAGFANCFVAIGEDIKKYMPEVDWSNEVISDILLGTCVVVRKYNRLSPELIRDYCFNDLSRDDGTHDPFDPTKRENEVPVFTHYDLPAEIGIFFLSAEIDIVTVLSDKGVVAQTLLPDFSFFASEEDLRSRVEKGEYLTSCERRPIEEWAMSVETPFWVTGINKLYPEKVEHFDFVSSLHPPPEVIKETVKLNNELLYGLIRCLAKQ